MGPSLKATLDFIFRGSNVNQAASWGSGARLGSFSAGLGGQRNSGVVLG